MIPRFEKFTANISLAYKYIIKIKAHEMSEFGLKASHVMCLFFIGRTTDGLSAGELVDLCNEDKSGISKALNVLKEKEYISANAKDLSKKYRIRYTITTKGIAIYDRIIDAINDVIEKCNQGLSENERRIFYETFEKIITNLINFHNEMEKPYEHI